MTKRAKKKLNRYQAKSTTGIYRCHDCGGMTEHDRYAFYRPPEPKCSVCYGTNLSITNKKVNRPASSSLAIAYQGNTKPLEVAKKGQSELKSKFSKERAKKAKKKPVKWDGHDEARHQTQAELEEINAVGVPITWVGPWVGGRPYWEDHVPNREDQLRERALKNCSNQ